MQGDPQEAESVERLVVEEVRAGPEPGAQQVDGEADSGDYGEHLFNLHSVERLPRDAPEISAENVIKHPHRNKLDTSSSRRGHGSAGIDVPGRGGTVSPQVGALL